ncbi:diguanylate cyclase [Thermosipho melanesiensis]|uniref:Diguanylate cyclase n=2 Tax=Thermosipho melanesiensis TaxID=46541 RepID=A6LLB3_THEM4|nr:GGDEF domain-containing protein [Thermosipho melanesiensis]ABR30714.1 diguanylate cyclase [Thermosipho melanesiensis BI429]APT73843.1 diguanylate cyclase [Thermosipho melanesiensis]OOC35783.1 diguanylate cyclase [Thermosipho melanesiensis]OOC39082.1 diguanylate cyclase [Thermosipho melanesiensis]OOC39230.1 diguanylate cyclase [Thermosipho melanesiensis]
MLKFYLKYFLIALLIFFGILTLFYILHPKGLVIENVGKKLPYITRLSSPQTASFTINISKNFDYLYLHYIETASFSIKANETIIYKYGLKNSGHTWFPPFLIPLPKNTNTLTIELFGMYSMGLGKIYFVKENEVWKYSILKFLTDNFVNISIGLILTLGFLLYLLSRNTDIEKQKAYLFFSYSSFLATVWLFDVLSLEYLYYPIRGALVASAYFSFYFLLIGIDLYNFSELKKSTKILSFFNIAVGILLLLTFSPHLLKLFSTLVSPLLIVNAIFVLYKIIKSYIPQNIVFATFFAITIIFDGFVLMFNLPLRFLSPYGIIAIFMSFSSSIIMEYKEKVHELNITYARSLIDPLTGAYNRGILRNLSPNENDILIFIDINKFKYINDTYGHEKGDELLKKLSSIVKSTLNSSNLFIRMGGDEFLIILKNSTKKEAEQTIQKIHEEFKNSFEFKPTFSWGISTVKSSIENSIRIADNLMYKMKGKNKKSHMI